MRPSPVEVFEWVVTPLAAALAVRHAARALGSGRALTELLALAVYGYALERSAIAAFASHAYAGSWRIAPGGVPLAVAVGWAVVILSAMTVAGRRGASSPFRVGIVAALVGVGLDLAMEPVAVALGLWRWTPPGAWLGVPIGNFVGWGVIVGVYAYGAESRPDARGLAAQALRRLALAGLSIAALLLVGAAWVLAGAERVFDAWLGFAFFGITLAAVLFPARGRSTGLPPANGLATRLARAGRPWALLVIAGAFAWGAALVDDWILRLTAAAVLVVVARVLAE